MLWSALDRAYHTSSPSPPPAWRPPPAPHTTTLHGPTTALYCPCAENELCNCEFSLAYGGKILLQDARLRLVRGRRYGLCGANGVGKVRSLGGGTEGGAGTRLGL